jgi:hypothetical protein
VTHVLGFPDQDRFENLDDSSKIVVDELTGLAQKLGSDGKGQGDPKPLSELLEGQPEDPKPTAKKFSQQAKRDQHLVEDRDRK